MTNREIAESVAYETGSAHFDSEQGERLISAIERAIDEKDEAAKREHDLLADYQKCVAGLARQHFDHIKEKDAAIQELNSSLLSTKAELEKQVAKNDELKMLSCNGLCRTYEAALSRELGEQRNAFATTEWQLNATITDLRGQLDKAREFSDSATRNLVNWQDRAISAEAALSEANKREAAYREVAIEAELTVDLSNTVTGGNHRTRREIEDHVDAEAAKILESTPSPDDES